MSDLAELIKAERLAAGLNGTFSGGNGTRADYARAKNATDAAIANLAETHAVSLPDRETLRRAVGGVLWNAANYPRKAQPYLLGTDTAPLTGKVVDAVLAALSTQPAAGEVEWRKSFAAELRAAVGAVVKPSAGAAGVFEFSPKGDSTEFWSYGNATAYSGAVIEVLRMLDPDMEFERATTYHGGRDKPRTLDEALAESKEGQA